MPFGLGVPELIIVLVIFLIVFGVGRLPQVGSALGQSVREFRENVREEAE
jgi:sec-independent protein translocase protein TatA